MGWWLHSKTRVAHLSLLCQWAFFKNNRLIRSSQSHGQKMNAGNPHLGKSGETDRICILQVPTG